MQLHQLAQHSGGSIAQLALLRRRLYTVDKVLVQVEGGVGLQGEASGRCQGDAQLSSQPTERQLCVRVPHPCWLPDVLSCKQLVQPGVPQQFQCIHSSHLPTHPPELRV